MTEWIQLGPKDEEGCSVKMKAMQKYIDVRMVCKRYGQEEAKEGGLVALTYKEALTLACQLPEIQALIKWALDVRDTMNEADLFAHGEEELKPFERREE